MRGYILFSTMLSPRHAPMHAAALLFFSDISRHPLLPMTQNNSPSCAAAYEGRIFVMADPLHSARIRASRTKPVQHIAADIGYEIAETIDMHNAALKNVLPRA